METIYENQDLCSKCGGKCCKAGGCQYSTDDFDSLKFDYLLGKLSEGYISIVSVLDFQTINKKVIAQPFLYVKARNVDRPVVDLLSMRTSCSCLTENGCMYSFDERPSGGVNLIPSENDTCYWAKDPMEFIMMWQPHQNVLRKLVKRINGRSVEMQLKEDAYHLFKDIFAKKFDGINEIEIKDVLKSLNDLALAFPEEFEKAYNEHQIIAPYDSLFFRK